MDEPLLSVLIPVYNEEATIGDVLDRVAAVDVRKEVIVVDDGSSDRTPEILRAKQTALKHLHDSRVNLGKGLAVRIALTYAEGDIVIVQDADLELDPGEYHTLMEPILHGRANVVYGSRFLRPSGSPVPLRSRVGNSLLTWLTNVLYGTELTDMTTAYKVARRSVIQRIQLSARGFEFDPELTAKIARLGERIVEVPISYRPRTPDEGKKIRWYHGLLYAWTLLKYRVVRSRAPASREATTRSTRSTGASR